MIDANKRQVAGDHYRKVEYQHWDMATDLALGYLEGQITKYISRAESKNGLQDVEKAEHFAQKMAEEADRGAYEPIHIADTNRCYKLASLHCHHARHSALVTKIIKLTVAWETVDDALRIRKLIQQLHKELEAKYAEEAAEATRNYVDQDNNARPLRSVDDAAPPPPPSLLG